MRINEDNFLQQLQKRNEDALYYIIDIYGDLIKSIVAKHLYNLPAVQEECIDDILLAIWDNITAFSPEKNSFKNWVAAIAKYKAIDYKRRELKLLIKENIDTLNLASSSNVETIIMEKELSKEIESMLSQLSNEDQQIFQKYYFYNQDIETIANEMDMKMSNIYNRLSRGRTKLRKLYGSR